MDQEVILLTILGMALVTYLPRLLPLLFLSSRKLPPLFARWLAYVPAAVLAAMLFPSLLAPEGSLALSADNLYLWAAVPTLLVAWRSKSLFASVVVGMLLVALGRMLGF